MDFNLTDIQMDIKKAAREFAEGEFPKVARECDRSETMDMELLQRARELGFVGIRIDEQYAGMGLGFLETALVMAKWYAAEVGVKVVDEALQLHGGYGYIDEYDISRFYRDAKIVEIYEGVKDVEKLVIGRHLIKGQTLF